MFFHWRWWVLFDSPNVLCELHHMIAKMIFLKNELMNAIKFITDICIENALHCILHNLFLSLSASLSWNILFYNAKPLILLFVTSFSLKNNSYNMLNYFVTINIEFRTIWKKEYILEVLRFYIWRGEPYLNECMHI